MSNFFDFLSKRVASEKKPDIDTLSKIQNQSNYPLDHQRNQETNQTQKPPILASKKMLQFQSQSQPQVKPTHNFNQVSNHQATDPQKKNNQWIKKDQNKHQETVINQTSSSVKEIDLMTHLTSRSNRVIMVAQLKARELKNEYIDSEHLLFGLINDQEIYNLFLELKISPQLIQEELAKIFRRGSYEKPPQISPRLKRIINDSLTIARKLGFEFIAPEHILLSLYNEGEGLGARILSKLGLKKEDLNKKITGKKEGLMTDEEIKAQKKKRILQEFTVDLTNKAAQGLLDPVVERAPTIERVIHILSRRTKNNPCLIGEAGVGKTAIVEGLAQKIINKEVPESLLNKRILQLDLMSILAGASYRGEFEERMKELIEQIKASNGQIILFIDEIHNIVGAGASGEGTLDVSSFLKPPLARGELQIIGATTITEYRKYIEKDPALERRFQPVMVPEPTEDQTIKMLQAIKDRYEAFHRVKISQEAIEAAVKLSKRYIGDRFLPDKAVDLIDEAASAVRLPLISLPEEIRSLESRLKELNQEKTEAQKRKDQVKLRILTSKIDDLMTRLREKQEDYQLRKAQTTTVVTEELIRDIVSRWTGIPVSRITSSEMTRLSRLEEIIKDRFVNQERAVTAIAQAIRRGRAGLKHPSRPIGSFVFLGPTGVGKTELAKVLAEILFGSEEAMIRLDMTEYMEKHEVAKLLGAPPGYVGYEEGGKLTEAVRRRPYCVVLFDEIEKAHRDVFNILLQILDDGRLTDNKGRVISFKNAVIICTSNIASDLVYKEISSAQNKKNENSSPDTGTREKIREKVIAELLKYFRPELVNRFDEIIIFDALGLNEVKKIVNLQLKRLNKLLEEQEIGLSYDEEVIETLVQLGFDPVYGARPLKRTIQRYVEDPLSNLIVTGKIEKGSLVSIRAKKGEFIFDIDRNKVNFGNVRDYCCRKCYFEFSQEEIKNSTVICPKCASKEILILRDSNRYH